MLSPEPMRQLRCATVEGGSGPVTPFMWHANNGFGCPACREGGQSVRHKTGQRMRRWIRHRRRVPAGKLRLLVVQRDVEENDGALLELTRLSLAHECTLLVASSLEDAARLIETVKVF